MTRARPKTMIAAAALASGMLAGCGQAPSGAASANATTVTSGPGGAWTSEPRARAQLVKFDTLDFDVYSNQKWDRLKESHAPDIKVTWPDGHETTGLDQHIIDLSYQFSFAPDTKIKVHPVKIAVGEWTSVMGVMEGTFTKPMKLPNGQLIAPTGKAFKLNMVTIGHWTAAGVMDHEWLMWDNDAFNKQVGLGK